MSVLDLVPARRGHFPYESGDHGDTWLDLSSLFVRPAALAPHVDELAGRLAPYAVSAVCGPLVGGAFLAHSVASVLSVGFTWTTWPTYDLAAPLPARSPAAALPPHARPATPPGARVAIVDDAVNAGSAVRASAVALSAAGATVVVVGALLARPGLDLGVPVESLADLPGNLWPAGSCPLCAAGAPLDEPGR